MGLILQNEVSQYVPAKCVRGHAEVIMKLSEGGKHTGSVYDQKSDHPT